MYYYQVTYTGVTFTTPIYKSITELKQNELTPLKALKNAKISQIKSITNTIKQIQDTFYIR